MHNLQNIIQKPTIFITGWLEPLLDRIALDDKTVAIPATDAISADTFSYDTRHARDITRGGFDFDLYYNWRTVPKQENERREGNLLAPIRSSTCDFFCDYADAVTVIVGGVVFEYLLFKFKSDGFETNIVFGRIL